MMGTEIDRVARMLEKTFDKSPWYGPSIMDVLKEVTDDQAMHKVGATHSILELILHMASWRTFAVQRLIGNIDFEVSEEANFRKPIKLGDAVQELLKTQIELIAAVKQFPEGRLGEIVPSKNHKYTYYTLIHGIIQHDVYHLGQIQLIRKSFG